MRKLLSKLEKWHPLETTLLLTSLALFPRLGDYWLSNELMPNDFIWVLIPNLMGIIGLMFGIFLIASKPLFWRKKALAFIAVLLITFNIFSLVAQIDWAASRADTGCFNTQLSLINALYFTITTFTTAGAGDIYPKSDMCQALVISQVTLGFVLGGFLLATVIPRLLQGRSELEKDIKNEFKMPKKKKED